MTRYDDFDLDLQNTKAGGATQNKTGYSVLWCPTLPVFECTKTVSDAICPTDNCPTPGTECYTQDFTCPPGPPETLTIEVCPYGNR